MFYLYPFKHSCPIGLICHFFGHVISTSVAGLQQNPVDYRGKCTQSLPLYKHEVKMVKSLADSLFSNYRNIFISAGLRSGGRFSSTQLQQDAESVL